MKKFVLGLVALCLLLAGSWYVIKQKEFRWTRSVEQQAGPFFRVDVKLKYKGEPLHMSFEVGCSVRLTNYADNSRSYEVGLTPNIYGWRMKDNQAVVVRPPSACHGETSADGRVPPGFIPVIIVYENADTLAFGRAYLGDEAYDGPSSELTFISSTVTASNYENWKKFREQGPKNVVTLERFYSGVGQTLEKKAAAGSKNPAYGNDCHYVQKIEFNENIRQQIRSLPSYTDGYWTTNGYAESVTLNKIIAQENNKPSPVHTDYREDNVPNDNSYAMPNSEWGIYSRKAPSAMGNISPPWWERESIVPIYPVRSGFMSRDLPNDAQKLAAILEGYKTNPLWMIDLGKRNRGFGYCWNVPMMTPETRAFHEATNRLRGFVTVDGARVANSDPDKYSNFEDQDQFIFADKFILFSFRFDLDSHEGGV